MAVHHHYRFTINLDMSAKVGVVNLYVGLTTGQAKLGPFSYGGSGEVGLDPAKSSNTQGGGAFVLMGQNNQAPSSAVFTAIPTQMSSIKFDIIITPYTAEPGKLHIGLLSSLIPGDGAMPTSSQRDPNGFGWITWGPNGQNFQSSTAEEGSGANGCPDTNFLGDMSVVSS